MSIRKAMPSDLEAVKNITRATISEIYPRYYPKGAVDFFLRHHSDEIIAGDIMQERVFVCLDNEQCIVGTVTVKENEILRLFVLPEYQGRGYGRELLGFVENLISESYNEIVIDASLSAKGIYLRRDYKEKEYNIIKTENNDFLCYDVMVKEL